MRGYPYTYNFIGNYNNLNFGIAIGKVEFISRLFGMIGYAQIFFYNRLYFSRRVIYVVKTFFFFK